MPQAKAKKQVLKVVRIGDREVVETIDVTGKPSAQVEKVMRGMLINMNTDDYFIDDDEAYADE